MFIIPIFCWFKLLTTHIIHKINVASNSFSIVWWPFGIVSASLTYNFVCICFKMPSLLIAIELNVTFGTWCQWRFALLRIHQNTKTLFCNIHSQFLSSLCPSKTCVIFIFQICMSASRWTYYRWKSFFDNFIFFNRAVSVSRPDKPLLISR